MRVSLKKLCAKKDVGAAIDELVKALDNAPIAIVDTCDCLIWGKLTEKLSKYTVEVFGEPIGWVFGDKKAAAVASMLSCLAVREVEKKSLAQEGLSKYRELTLLYNISEKIIGSLDIQEVAAVVLEEAQRCIRATHGVAILRDETTDGLEQIGRFGEEGDGASFLNANAGIFEGAIASGKGEIFNAIEIECKPTSKKQQGIAAMMCVPLKTKEKAIGAIAIGSTHPVNYTAEELKLLSALACQAATAIDVLLQENKLKESRRQAILFRLANQIRRSLKLDTILETAVSEIRNLLQVDRAWFVWYHPTHTNVRALDATDPPSNPQPCASCLRFPTSDAWQIVTEAKHPAIAPLIDNYSTREVGGFGRKILQMEVVRVENVTTLADPLMRQFFLKQEMTSIIAVPIETHLGKMGFVACATTTKVRSWSEDEVELLQAVANQLAIAIDQAELYEQSLTSARVSREQAQQLQNALCELQQTQAQLIQSEKMSGLGQMVAGIAHEINNPVNFIHGNLMHLDCYTEELLQVLTLYAQHYPEPVAEIQDAIDDLDLEFLDHDLPKLLASMKLGTERIREIVKSLRIFSRIDEAEMKPVKVRDGIESTLTLLQHRLVQPGKLQIHLVKDYSDLPSVECYPAQLNQVFMNLLNNAIDALELKSQDSGVRSAENIPHPTPTIRIRTELLPASNLKRVPSRIRIQIADNGIGMSETVQRRLFDPFFTTKPVGKGTGLGLSISYSIVVEKHRGTLHCHSQVGQGSEFTIELPIRQVQSAPIQCSSDIVAIELGTSTLVQPISNY